MAVATPPPSAAGFPSLPAHTGPVPALEFIDRILDKIGTPNRPKSLDRLVAGDVTTAVTGIAVVAMATFDALKASAAAKQNLVVTLESTFWSGNDDLTRMEGNALYQAKRDFIRANNLIVFHLQEHLLDKLPNPIAVGMSQALGWDAHAVDKANPLNFQLPATTLLGLARELGEKLNDRTLRVVGDPALPVAHVGVSWGNASQIPTIRLLNTAVDVVVVGYTHEWEAVEYAQDMVAAGDKKGLILLGEVKSEQAGMQVVAGWLKSIIIEVPVAFIAIAEPYWTPDNPINEINEKP